MNVIWAEVVRRGKGRKASSYVSQKVTKHVMYGRYTNKQLSETAWCCVKNTCHFIVGFILGDL
jgi:hypothetical protein